MAEQIEQFIEVITDPEVLRGIMDRARKRLRELRGEKPRKRGRPASETITRALVLREAEESWPKIYAKLHVTGSTNRSRLRQGVASRKKRNRRRAREQKQNLPTDLSA